MIMKDKHIGFQVATAAQQIQVVQCTIQVRSMC